MAQVNLAYSQEPEAHVVFVQPQTNAVPQNQQVVTYPPQQANQGTPVVQYPPYGGAPNQQAVGPITTHPQQPGVPAGFVQPQMNVAPQCQPYGITNHQAVAYPPVHPNHQGTPVVQYPPPYGGAPHQQAVGPFTTQPQTTQWIPRPVDVPTNCPPGLEYLMQVDQLLVHQQVEILEVLTGFETENKYQVKNSVGQQVFYAAEQSSCCGRCFCSNIRPFEMKLTDNHGNEVIHINRPLACQSFLCPCWLQTMEVSSPPGTVIGNIEQEWSLFPKFLIKDAAGDVVLRIEGPFCTCSCFGDVVFDIYSRDGDIKIGKVTKQWSGLVREAFTDADNFGINFPMDLDVKVKATLLAACFLIDFMYFEDNQNDNNQVRGIPLATSFI